MPIPHSEEFPVPMPRTPEPCAISSDDDDGEENYALEKEISEYVPPKSSLKEPHMIQQQELNDLFRDLNLSIRQSETLGSRLQEWNLLSPETTISLSRKRNKHLATFFTQNDSICYCNDINGLMNELRIAYRTNEWRLFIDGSKTSLKAVLLHNGSEYPSIPVAYSITLKETYDTMQFILNLIKYRDSSWKVCADLKVIALLLGLQGGFTKYCCFLCMWDSRATEKHYLVKDWPMRSEFVAGQSNVKYSPLINPQNVLLPPLHIKLGLMKNFVKAMDKTGEGFLHLKSVFPKLSDAKLKEGIFVGPQIRKLMKNGNFNPKLNTKELSSLDIIESCNKRVFRKLSSRQF